MITRLYPVETPPAFVLHGSTENASSYQLPCYTESSGNRPVIFVTARVHPGETPASFVMHGFVEWLLSAQAAAQKLRQGATVVVVPMLNPDGVFLGNYRSEKIIVGTYITCACVLSCNHLLYAVLTYL